MPGKFNMPSISAYIPCYNSKATIRQAIESVQRQTHAVDEIFVIDDASEDGSSEIAKSIGVRVLGHERNLGRGAVRAQAMLEAQGNFVLCCDSSKQLAPDFVERSLVWMEMDNVAAVFGRILQGAACTAAERWRGRHLLKTQVLQTVSQTSSLITAGAMLKRSVVLQVGNFNQTLRHSEDKELGARLLNQGFKVVFDPALSVTTIAENDLCQVLERYWRWHAGVNEETNVVAYLKQIAYSLKVMAWQDIKEGDPSSALISLISPHYQFWRSRLRRNQPLV
jgi:glycosyltransferase involved in cell wall biosynthesis